MASKAEGKDLQQQTGTALAGFEDSEIAGLDNLGYSTKSEDGLVPILAILQENSGEAKAAHPKAKAYDDQKAIRVPGNLIIRSLKRLFPVSTDGPLEVIPCGFTHIWMEWVGEPGDGVPVNRYPFDELPDTAVEKVDPNDQDGKRMIQVMPNGNRLQDTREHYCLVKWDDVWHQVMIPMGGTNHTVSRMWTELQKARVIPTTKTKAPAWFGLYSLGTQYNTRGSQSWFTYDIKQLGWVNDRETREMGKALNESLKTGAIAPDLEGESGESSARKEATI